MHVNTTSSSFFNDPSFAKQWSEIETALGVVGRAADGDNDTEIGWIEGRVHETRSTQKEAEVLLVRLPESSEHTHTDDLALRVYITCPEFTRFVFAINQHVKVSLKGARIVRELTSLGRAMLPFSLVFNSCMAIQSVHGGVSMPDGFVVATQQNNNNDTMELECDDSVHLVSATSNRPAPEVDIKLERPSTPTRTTASITPDPSPIKHMQFVTNIAEPDAYDDYSVFPSLNTLTEGMMTPLLGIVESAKLPSTTTSGDLCVSLTIADSSSYTSGRGFKLTCFTSSSRLSRDLPASSPGSILLLKSVKINRWPGGLIGTVYPNKLDWIVYDVEADKVSVPRHAAAEPRDGFYEDLEQRKVQFRRFVKAVGDKSGRKDGGTGLKTGE